MSEVQEYDSLVYRELLTHFHIQALSKEIPVGSDLVEKKISIHNPGKILEEVFYDEEPIVLEDIQYLLQILKIPI
jgi:hypothetical protein